MLDIFLIIMTQLFPTVESFLASFLKPNSDLPITQLYISQNDLNEDVAWLFSDEKISIQQGLVAEKVEVTTDFLSTSEELTFSSSEEPSGWYKLTFILAYDSKTEYIV